MVRKLIGRILLLEHGQDTKKFQKTSWENELTAMSVSSVAFSLCEFTWPAVNTHQRDSLLLSRE